MKTPKEEHVFFFKLATVLREKPAFDVIDDKLLIFDCGRKRVNNK